MSWSLRLDDFAWHILPKSDIADLVRDNLILMTYWLHWDLLLLNWWLLAQIYRHGNVCQRVCSDYGRRQFKIIQSAMWIKSKTLKSSRWTPNQKRRIIDIIDIIVIEVREVNAWVAHFLSLRCVLRSLCRALCSAVCSLLLVVCLLQTKVRFPGQLSLNSSKCPERADGKVN